MIHIPSDSFAVTADKGVGKPNNLITKLSYHIYSSKNRFEKLFIGTLSLVLSELLLADRIVENYISQMF